MTTLPVPPSFLELTWRSITSRDVPEIFELCRHIEEVDKPANRVTLMSLADTLDSPWCNKEKDSLLGIDGRGRVRAWATITCSPGADSQLAIVLAGGVHPVWRNRGVGRALLAWQDARARQLAQSTDFPAGKYVIAHSDARDTRRRRLLGAAGFSPKRWMYVMRTKLSEGVAEPQVPAGLELRSWDDSLEDATRKAHNAAFVDHFAHAAHTLQSWRKGRTEEVRCWSFQLVPKAAPDTVAGYIRCSRYEQTWASRGYTSGYADVLAVIPQWQRRGAARALVLAAMGKMCEDGMEYAELAVDSTSRGIVPGVFADLGFLAEAGAISYVMQLDETAN